MTSCGLWLARRRLVAVLVPEGSEAPRLVRAPLTGDARFGLLEYLRAADAEIVTTEAFARADSLPTQAACHGLAVWSTDDRLLTAILRAAAIRDPARAAALLARLPRIPLLRATLRHLVSPDTHARQLALL